MDVVAHYTAGAGSFSEERVDLNHGGKCKGSFLECVLAHKEMTILMAAIH
jgi:hypothetical protein